MTRLEMLPPHFFFILFLALLNNIAFTSPQAKKREPPNFRSVPPTSFACNGRTAGYYADPEAECQAYHMCDTQERKYSYLCPGLTLFNQKYMVCDHWHAVNCSIATQYYVLNNMIGKVPEKKSTVEENNIIRDQKPTRSKKTSPVFKFNPIKPSLPIKRNHQSKHESLDKRTQAPGKAAQRLKTTAFSKLPPRTSTIPQTIAKTPTTTLKIPTTASKIPTTTVKIPTTTAKIPSTTAKTFVNTKTTTRKPFVKPTLSFRILTPIKEFSFSPNLVQTEKKSHLFNARGSAGPKIKFGAISTDDSQEDKPLSGIKFRPLFKKPKNSLFDKRNFTVPPEFLTTTPSPAIEDGDVDDDVSQIGSIEVEPIIPFLIPPLVESPSQPPEEDSDSFSVTAFLVPPLRGPVVLQGDNQEQRTPLVFSNDRPFNGRSFGLSPPQSITPPRFSFSRPNKDFFIPSPGLLPPFPDNSVSDEDDSSLSENSLFIPLQMTMTFPNSTTITRRRRPLRRNPNCPRCHPAFLKANECQPCVIIK